MFKLANNGYSMTFENGYTVSVRWHQCINYVQNRELDSPHTANYNSVAKNSVDAEVAVIADDGTFISTPFNDNDTVIGWQKPHQVVQIMKWAMELEEDKT